MIVVWSVVMFLVLTVLAGQEALQHGVVHSCGNSTLTVHVSMDFFNRFDASAFSLGDCPPTSISARLLTFQYGLLDCRAGRLVTDQERVYWNYLKYQIRPVPAMEEPQLHTRLECRYPVDEVPVPSPKFPLISFLDADGSLVFSMKVMNDDWTAERLDSVFFLGTSINLEASVIATYHQDLRLYIEECVATPTSSLATSPENYTIINNYGCLVDGKTGNSKYLPRSDESHLQFVVQAFKFVSLEGADIYIHCKVVVWDPSWDAHQSLKACSFDQKTESWQLLDAPLQSSLCDCCNTICQPIQSRHKRELKTGITHITKVGPLRVHSVHSESRTSAKIPTDNQRVMLVATPLLACFLGILFLSLYKWKIQHKTLAGGREN
ncbi:zona pellucida sperm-binding protein 3-like [Scyliorhinus torazame]|uniref:zona pellucida sperm-binding protein 3-like n=1 Tax=Scyliorhinus torazame TaxID=75743 RepID=UPI003B5CFCB8